MDTADDRLSINAAGGMDAGVDPGLLSPVDKRKYRQKKYFKIGVGGFLVRQTRQRSINERMDGKFSFFQWVYRVSH